jgi:hypothetical protein
MPRPPNPAPPWRGTLFAECKNAPGGWSEEYWIQSDTADAAMGLLLQLMDTRTPLMSINYVFKYARISDDSIRGDAVIKNILTGDGTGTIDHAGAPPEMAALIRVELEERHHAMRFLHGLSNDQYDVFFQIDSTKNNWGAAFADYLDFLKTNCKVFSKDFNAGTYKNRTITDVGFGKVREHRVGRPFALYRGRRAKAAV